MINLSCPCTKAFRQLSRHLARQSSRSNEARSGTKYLTTLKPLIRETHSLRLGIPTNSTKDEVDAKKQVYNRQVITKISLLKSRRVLQPPRNTSPSGEHSGHSGTRSLEDSTNAKPLKTGGQLLLGFSSSRISS